MEQFEGRSLEEVLQTAAERAGCRTEDLRFEVLQESRGFLGVGVRSISVRVELPEPSSPARPIRASDRPSREVASAADAGERSSRAIGQTVPESSSPRGDRGSSGPADEEDERGFVEDEPTGPDPTAPEVEALVRDVVSRMGVDVTVSMTEDDARILVEISGTDRALVLGDDGETLDALQYVINRMAQRELGTIKRVQLESDGFRFEREEEIRQMAMAAADKVRRTAEPIRLPLLNPYERRIVHVTLSGAPGVTTESEGGGFVKRVVVKPQGGRGEETSPRRGPRDAVVERGNRGRRGSGRG